MRKPRARKCHDAYLSTTRTATGFEVRVGPGTSYQSLADEIARCGRETTPELVWRWELREVFDGVGFVGVATLPGCREGRA
jgi:hypothetical protein